MDPITVHKYLRFIFSYCNNNSINHYNIKIAESSLHAVTLGRLLVMNQNLCYFQLCFQNFLENGTY